MVVLSIDSGFNCMRLIPCNKKLNQLQEQPNSYLEQIDVPLSANDCNTSTPNVVNGEGRWGYLVTAYQLT